MLRAGLIGFPSTGKTTLFQLMTGVRGLAAVSARETGRSAPKADANVGVSRVPDERLDRLTALFEPKKRTPAVVEFADLGAARAGSPAQSLLDVAPFRNADALVHVLRLFRDESVPHPKGSIDPARDARAMEEEMILADLGVAERRLERLEKDLKKSASAELKKEQELLLRCRAVLERGEPLRAIELDFDRGTGAPEGIQDAKRLRGFQFLSAKPLLLALNVDEADAAAAPAEAEARIAREGDSRTTKTLSLVVCAKIELEIAQLEPADAATFLADLGLAESGLDRVIRASYDLLGYISFFTVGPDECRAWSIPRGTPAQIAAGEIHSDIARGFIRAEVVRYEDLIARGSIPACRDAGELRLEGKDYIVRDGDVINFRFAT
jgi:ribosome-binding ATPase